jgi:hypothetical protein
MVTGAPPPAALPAAELPAAELPPAELPPEPEFVELELLPHAVRTSKALAAAAPATKRFIDSPEVVGFQPCSSGGCQARENQEHDTSSRAVLLIG